MAAHHSLSLSLPTIVTRSRVPLALRRHHLLLPHRRVAARDRARRGLASASSPSRARPLGYGVGAGRSWSGGRGHRAMSTSTNSTVAEELSVAEKSGDIEPLPFVHDKHGGVIIEMTTPMDPGVFSASLKAALAKWREQGIRGVWIKLPITLSNLIPSVVEEGFWYHHAEETYLMLAYWLPNTTHTLPVNATHRVSVGAFIMNDKREILAVQEKSGVLRGLGVWKVPTGVVEPGEDINVGAVREVKEETGIDAEFVEVLGFRQSHKSFFDKSDLFFVCLLRPLSYDITKQDSEIEACQWMPIEEFAAQPFLQKHDLAKYILEVGLAKVDKEYAGLAVPLRAGGRRKQLVGSGGGGAAGGGDFCWLTQEDLVRYFLNSIGLFYHVAARSVSSLGLVRADFLSVRPGGSALSAVPLIRRAVATETAVAVVTEDGHLVGEISPALLAACDETAAAAIATLSVADLMAYIDHFGSPPEHILRAVKAGLKDKGLDDMLALIEDETLSSFSSLSSASSSSDEEAGRAQLRRPSSGSYGRRSAEEPVVCSPASSLVAVMVQALAHRVSYVWVLDEDNDCRLAGIVTFADVLRVFREQLL